MKAFLRLPRRIRFALVVIGLNMVIFTVFRVIFWVLFRSAAPGASGFDFLWAWYLGFKFDLRLSLLI
ncbi:MAG: hypothetical protein ACE5I8_06310, partial [Thermodesulfobacteriota bacterium]